MLTRPTARTPSGALFALAAPPLRMRNGSARRSVGADALGSPFVSILFWQVVEGADPYRRAQSERILARARLWALFVFSGHTPPERRGPRGRRSLQNDEAYPFGIFSFMPWQTDFVLPLEFHQGV